MMKERVGKVVGIVFYDRDIFIYIVNIFREMI